MEIGSDEEAFGKIRDWVAEADDPVATACALIGVMSGVISLYADRGMAAEALRIIADDIEKSATMATRRRVRDKIGKDTG